MSNNKYQLVLPCVCVVSLRATPLFCLYFLAFSIAIFTDSGKSFWPSPPTFSFLTELPSSASCVVPEPEFDLLDFLYAWALLNASFTGSTGPVRASGEGSEDSVLSGPKAQHSSLAGLRDAEGGPASFVGGATRNEENHGGCKQAMCDVCEGKRRISSNKYVSQCSQRRGTDPFSFWFLFCCLLDKANKPNQQFF